MSVQANKTDTKADQTVHTKNKLNTREAADYLATIGTPFSAGTLEVWRCQGRGPEFIRVARRIFYTKPALDRFSNGQVVQTIDSRG